MSGSSGWIGTRRVTGRVRAWTEEHAPGLRNWRRWASSAVLALIATLLICRISATLSPVEFGLLNRWFAVRPARQPSPEIVLVGIERGDTEAHEASRLDDCTCSAIPRRRLGAVIAAIKRAGASVIVLDLVLRHPCPVGVNEDDHREAHDAGLVKALETPGEVILAAGVNPNPDSTYFDRPAQAFVGELATQRIVASPLLHNPSGVIRGVGLIQTGAPSEMARALAAPLRLVGVTLAPLSMAAYAAHLGHACEIPEVVDRNHVSCAGARIPVWASSSIYLLEPFMPPPRDRKYTMFINWVGPPGTFPTYPISAILANDELAPDVLNTWLRNRIVIIGAVGERLNTPYLGTSRHKPDQVDQRGSVTMSGLEVHANAIDTVISRRFLEPLPPQAMWAIIFLCSLVTALAVRALNTWQAIVAMAATIGLVAFVAMHLVWLNIWLYSATPAASVVLCGLMTGLYSYARSREQTTALERQAVEREAATATIVHDLKQPLAAIGGLTSVMQMAQTHKELEHEEPELLERISRQVERALSDIDELLVANPDRELNLNVTRFDLLTLTRDLAVAQGAGSTIHEIEVHGPDEGVLIDGDFAYLARAISNLMDNAMKYWPDGGTVLVEAGALGDTALLRVLDQGMGISADNQPSIFDRYHRAVPEDSSIPGTGIGLYSVKRIVEAHGGDIEVDSELGRGSTFAIRLPLRQPLPQASTSEGLLP